MFSPKETIFLLHLILQFGNALVLTKQYIIDDNKYVEMTKVSNEFLSGGETKLHCLSEFVSGLNMCLSHIDLFLLN